MEINSKYSVTVDTTARESCDWRRRLIATGHSQNVTARDGS